MIKPDISADEIRKASLSLLFLQVMLVGVIYVMMDSYALVFQGVVGLIVVWTIYIVFYCEAFLVFAIYFFSQMLLLFLLFSTAAGWTASEVIGVAPAIGGALSGSVILLAATRYTLIKGPCCFECRGTRVEPSLSSVPNTSWYTSTIVLITFIISAGVVKLFRGPAVDLLAAALGTAAALVSLHACRHSLRSLRILWQRQRHLPQPYTFMHIEEIRAARRRWWGGRLLRWLGMMR